MCIMRRLRLLLISFAPLVLLFLAGRATSQTASDQPAYRDPKLPVGERVADLLGRMTLKEKVAQTHALWKSKDLIMDEQGNFSPAKARDVMKHGIGQITRASGNKGPRENAESTSAIQKFLTEQTRLGIPAMVHEEGLHGFVAQGATSFPQAIALASTWDVDLVERVFGVAAAEMRSRGAQQALTPVLDLARDPRWGGTEETYGEDPYLVSRLGVACVRGFQGPPGVIDRQHVIATAKHFAVHGQPEAGINVAPANYSELVVREYLLLPFQKAIREAGAMCVMPSYNEVDGVPSHGNPGLLQRVLREESGFRGFIVSDYHAIPQLESLNHVVANKADAARLALESGVDVELPDIDCYALLADQIRQGSISEATLDKPVARILRAKFLAGLFEDPYVDPDNALRGNNQPVHRELALRAVREAIVLPKNRNNLLPLDRAKIKSLAVISPNAAPCRLGGYSADPGRCESGLDGITAFAGDKIRVNYAEGVKFTENDKGWQSWYLDEAVPADPVQDEQSIAEAVKVAKASDVAVLFLGGNEQTCREAWSASHPGDCDSLDLVGRQNDLVKAILATGKPTIVFLLGGRPVSINYIAENVPAIPVGWYLVRREGQPLPTFCSATTTPAAGCQSPSRAARARSRPSTITSLRRDAYTCSPIRARFLHSGMA